MMKKLFLQRDTHKTPHSLKRNKQKKETNYKYKMMMKKIKKNSLNWNFYESLNKCTEQKYIYKKII